MPSDPTTTAAALTFADKQQLVRDLRSTWTIYERDHGLREAMFIATGGGKRFEHVNDAICDSRDATHSSRISDVIRHAILTVERGP